MSTEQAIDPELVEQTKQQIRSLVSEIAQFARQDIGAQEFYSEFLNRVVSALAAVGGAVWTPSEGGGLQLDYQINLRETELAASDDNLQRHGRLLQKVMRTGEPALVPPHSGEGAEDQAGNPTSYLLVLAPVRVESETRGVVEVFQRASADVRTQRGYLRFLAQMAELVSDFLRSRQLRQFSDRQALWNQLENFTRAAHSSLDPGETAYTLVNEARRLIGCDRVSIAIKKGKKCYIEAISGQDVIDRRSNTVSLLNRLSTAVVAAGEPVWYSGDTTDMAPQVEEAIEEYVDDSHAKNVAILPLVRQRPELEVENESAGEVIGALIVEQIEDSRTRDGMVQRVNVVCEHSSTALGNALQHSRLFLLPLWRTLGKARWVLAARTLPKTIAVLLALVGAGAALAIVPADFRIEGKGTLQPVHRKEVFSQIEGTVIEIFVDHGTPVKKGQALARMRNSDLDVQFEQLLGEKAEAVQNLAAAKGRSLGMDHRQRSDPQQPNRDEEDRARAEERQLREKTASLDRRLKLLEEKKKLLIVRSPIDGHVTTWDLKNLLDERTVQPGQVLMSVSDASGPWELEVLMPEDQMGYVARAQKEFNRKDLDVSYYLANEPGEKHDGQVKDVHLIAESRGEEGNTVMIYVGIDKADLGDFLTQGAGVSARVDCGKRAIGFVWFHDLFEFVQSRILFRL
ncbi:MAG TPA: GAF domain-containing protein [Pirellulales bacterium]|jgi:multidrug efflux pump subunit AcrA (membrane-fusion protein)